MYDEPKDDDRRSVEAEVYKDLEKEMGALRERHVALISSLFLAREAILAFNHARAKEILDEAIKQDSLFRSHGTRS